ncbi:hypothetical protein ACSNOK_16510, partial [Streptomyces sp. URMC 126]|uniref:hypothetical protein n=1 Tax=Streptomyces sp. URMC 126 TaxID=3423401 RepID=UPI003F1A5543
MRAESLAGRVVAVVSRRAPAFRDAPGTNAAHGWAQAVERGLARAREDREERTARTSDRYAHRASEAAIIYRAAAARKLRQRLNPAEQTAARGAAGTAASTLGAPRKPSGLPLPLPPLPGVGTADEAILILARRLRRVGPAAHQRGTAGSSAAGRTASLLPGFLCGLLVVALLTLPFGIAGLAGLLVWLAAGALFLLGATGRGVARRLLRLRPPTAKEAHGLAPVWREVCARSGLDPGAHDVWIADADRLDGTLPAGRVIGVPRGALDRLNSHELAALLARELGRRRGTPLPYLWYALPGRAVAWLLHTLVAGPLRWSRTLSYLTAGLVLAGAGASAFATRSWWHWLPLLLLATAVLQAALDRRAELRADRFAADLGFALPLAVVLTKTRRDHPNAPHTPLTQLLS